MKYGLIGLNLRLQKQLLIMFKRKFPKLIYRPIKNTR